MWWLHLVGVFANARFQSDRNVHDASGTCYHTGRDLQWILHPQGDISPREHLVRGQQTTRFILDVHNLCRMFILSAPETYPHPDVFDPERFLGQVQQPDPHEVCFGWGRRRCPGALLAESTIFICVAMTLATLDVSRCVESGVECVPKYDVEEGNLR